MTITTDMLTAFVTVAERGSVSAAAGHLGVGKSLVSKRVAQLETAAEATLFSRSTRGIALTPAGEAYLDCARRALQDLATAAERLRDLRQELSGCIRITATVSWGQQVLAKLLPEFLHLHPGIEIELQLGDRMVDLAAERIDLALRWTNQPTPGLVATPVAKVDWVVAAAPDYLHSRGVPQSPPDLAAHECLAYWRERSDEQWAFRPRGPATDAATDKDTDTIEVRVRGRYHANNVEAVADAAVAGLGIAMIPGYMAQPALADGRLHQVLDAWVPLTRFGAWITAFGAPERMGAARNRVLLAFLRERLAG
jgi:DNA-binding transcriptional LysR family regulator